ncbi:MAG: hypothetical protein K2O37_06280, partial [Bacteroidales bacterium]|nr:hypothetical protein [Bacteroidales bacterium]
VNPQNARYNPGRACTPDTAWLECYQSVPRKGRFSQTLQYSLDGTNWQTTGIFRPLPDQTEYRIYVRNQYGCEAQNSPIVVPKTTMKSNAWLRAGLNDTCYQGSTVTVKGDTIVDALPLWSTSGTGSFNNTGILHPTYTPSTADFARGSVTLYLHANTENECTLADSIEILLLGCEIYDFKVTGNTNVCFGGIGTYRASFGADEVAAPVLNRADHLITWSTRDSLGNMVELHTDYDTASTVRFAVTDSIWYYVTGTTVIGCEFKDSLHITLAPAPEMVISHDVPCPTTPITFRLDTALLFAQSGYVDYAYNWSVTSYKSNKATVLGTSTADSLALAPLPAQTDRIVVKVNITTPEGCTYSRSKTLTYAPWEDLSGYIAKDTAVCAVSSTVLLADIESLDILLNYTMQWSNARGTENPLEYLANDPIDIDSTNSYYLTITRPSDGCHYYDTINVQVDPMPEVYMPDTIFKCTSSTSRFAVAPDSVKYNKANAFYWYLDEYWPCKPTVASVNQRNLAFTPCRGMLDSAQGWATLHLRTEGLGACAGKVAYDTVTIMFRGLMSVDVKNVSVCLDDSAAAPVVVTGLQDKDVDHYEYSFMRPGSVLRNATDDTLLYAWPDTVGTFVYKDTLKVWNSDGCRIDKQYSVTFKGTARILQDTVTICAGDTATLTVINATSTPSWQELGKNTNLYAGKTYRATPTKTTTYVASRFASKGTCQKYTTDTVTVVVKEGFYLRAVPDSNFCNPGLMRWAVDSVDAEDVVYTWVDSA